MGSAFVLKIIFNYLNSQYNEDNYKMLIRIFHSFLNRSISIIKEPNRYYLPTPPLGQDMTQGQFLS